MTYSETAKGYNRGTCRSDHLTCPYTLKRCYLWNFALCNNDRLLIVGHEEATFLPGWRWEVGWIKIHVLLVRYASHEVEPFSFEYGRFITYEKSNTATAKMQQLRHKRFFKINMCEWHRRHAFTNTKYGLNLLGLCQNSSSHSAPCLIILAIVIWTHPSNFHDQCKVRVIPVSLIIMPRPWYLSQANGFERYCLRRDRGWQKLCR